MIDIAASFSLAAPAFFSRTGPIAAHQWHRHHQSRVAAGRSPICAGSRPKVAAGGRTLTALP